MARRSVAQRVRDALTLEVFAVGGVRDTAFNCAGVGGFSGADGVEWQRKLSQPEKRENETGGLGFHGVDGMLWAW
jgi:hypothetical protein